MTVETRHTRVAPSRATRSAETARLLAEAAASTGPLRADLVNQVVVLNLGVATAIARRFRDRSVALDDLEQVANVALVRAAQKFDPAQERDFLSYAVPTITGEIKRHFRDLGWTVRPPRRVQEIQTRVIDAYKRAQELGEPTAAEHLAAAGGWSVKDVREALLADGCFTPVSLDMSVTAQGSFTLADMLVAEDDRDQDAAEARLLLQPLLRRLSERDRRILHLRFVQEQTQEEIGADVGLTQMQVSRIIRRLLAELRGDLMDDGGTADSGAAGSAGSAGSTGSAGTLRMAW